MEASGIFASGESGFFTCVRVRPPSDGRADEGAVSVANPTEVALASTRTHIRTGAARAGTDSNRFQVDSALGPACSDEETYTTVLRPVVKKVMRGQTATVVAYGQTGSGKTHTVTGLCSRFPKDLFADLAVAAAAGMPGGELSVEVVAVELLGKGCRDLLRDGARAAADPPTATAGASGKGAAASVTLLEDASGEVVLRGASVHPAADAGALVALLEAAAGKRATAATHAHDRSSRTHAVYRIALVGPGGSGGGGPARGRLTLVDLAGSERGADRGDGASRERVAESVAINKSLSALRDCMRASDAYHSAGRGGGGNSGGGAASVARYRQSSLTLLLRDAFAFGDACTVFVACLSPLARDQEHSKSTLLYTRGVLDRQRERAALVGRGAGAGGGHQSRRRRRRRRCCERLRAEGLPG